MDCNLTALSIKKHIPFILSVILLTIENEDCQTEIAIWQNLIIVSGKYVTLQQNNPRRPKRKWDSENKLFCMAWLDKIRIQATKVAVKKVKIMVEKV